MKSRAEVINRALAILGVAGTGQPVQAEDFDKAKAVLPGMLTELAKQRVISPIPDGDDTDQAIPDEIFTGLSALLALDAGPEVAAAPLATDEQREMIKRMIRRVTAVPPGYEPVIADYF